MRVFMSVCTAVLMVAAAGGGALAADLPEEPAPTPYTFTPAPSPISGIISEMRFGVTAHDPFSPEQGSADINGEILSPKLGHSDNPFLDVLIPRFHVGGSVNTAGKTSYAYIGLTWTYNFTKQIFAEASLGGAIHNGYTGKDPKDGWNSLGCSPLFRESAALGYRFDEHWSVMATVDHMSNAGLCKQNRGLTNVGAKIGYTF